MAEPFIYHRRVDFFETDMAGIAHFSNFFRWMEAAEAALLRHLGIPMTDSDGMTDYGWPRVRASAEYHDAIRFGDELELRLWVRAIKVKAVEYEVKAYVMGEGEPRHAASGKMTTVYVCKPTTGGPMKSLALTPAILDKLAPLADDVIS